MTVLNTIIVLYKLDTFKVYLKYLKDAYINLIHIPLKTAL